MVLASMEILPVVVAVQVLNTPVFVWSRRVLLASNLVLRQQLIVFKRKRPRPTLRDGDRLFWSLISRFWKDWRSALVIVKPDTVIRWQKRRFTDFWRRKSAPGRPRIERQHIEFIRRISETSTARMTQDLDPLTRADFLCIAGCAFQTKESKR